jgi:hypothetical protein
MISSISPSLSHFSLCFIHFPFILRECDFVSIFIGELELGLVWDTPVLSSWKHFNLEYLVEVE